MMAGTAKCTASRPTFVTTAQPSLGKQVVWLYGCQSTQEHQELGELRMWLLTQQAQ